MLTVDKLRRMFAGKQFLVAAVVSLFMIGCSSTKDKNQNSTALPLPNGRSVLATSHGQPIGERTIADIAEDAMKSVVNIDTKTAVMVPDYGFHVFDYFDGGMSMRRTPKLEVSGTGTGVIIKPDGYILTNNHVVGQAKEITVTLNDKRLFKGKVIGRDKFSDLALVKIAAAGLPVARLGSAKLLRPGEFAIAIGSPAGLSNTVTMGIISGLGRSLGLQPGDVGLIQTDTAINPGNSGGPLLNLHGEVIGINTAVRKDYQNIGFAIPIDSARTVAESLLAHGSASHPYLGIAMQDLNERLNQALGLPSDMRGVIIARVSTNSPAAESGLQAGDVLLTFDDQSVNSAKDVQDILKKHQSGDKVAITVVRNGRHAYTEAIIEEYPENEDDS